MPIITNPVTSAEQKAMLATDNIIVSDYLIANTAILGGNSNATKQLKFTEKLNDMLLILEKSKKVNGVYAD